MERRFASTIVMAEIVQEDYSSFLDELPLDNRLLPTYEAWREQFEHVDFAHRAAGNNTQHCVVPFDEFMAFMESVNMTPSYAALETYAAYKFRNQMGWIDRRRSVP